MQLAAHTDENIGGRTYIDVAISTYVRIMVTGRDRFYGGGHVDRVVFVRVFPIRLHTYGEIRMSLIGSNHGNTQTIHRRKLLSYENIHCSKMLTLPLIGIEFGNGAYRTFLKRSFGVGTVRVT